MSDPYSAAVNTFFDRLEAGLPVYIGQFRPTIIGLVAGGVVHSVVKKHVAEMRKTADESKDPRDKSLYVMTQLGSIVACLFVAYQVKEMAIVYANYKFNKQHLANEQWVKRYAKAIRSTF